MLRNKLFWIQDFLKGSKIRNHLNQIKNHFSNGMNDGKIESAILDKLLTHARETVPFYNRNNKIYKELLNFPVINKTIIRKSLDDFISYTYKKNDLFTVVTSGSTGTPFKTYQNKNKKLRNYADTIYFAQLSGFDIGIRLMYLKIWAKEKMNSSLVYRMQNIVPIDVLHLDDYQIQRMIERMENKKIAYGMLGYSSALELICQYLDRSSKEVVKADIKSLITMSESLNEYTKTSLKKYFGVEPVSRYSNLENGIIAQQLTGSGNKFLINTASYHIEVLKFDSDEQVMEGEIGRIVITDLYNYAMPLIRYDTGDVGAIVSDQNNSGIKYFSKIEGRKLDLLFDTKGKIVSSYIMYKNMWQYTDIKQYQLIQEDIKDYRFKINAEKGFNREKQLVKEYKSYLGEDANFVVEYVNEIPLLSSGKRRKVVNKYYV